mmetsp:Transcript_34583/g.75590  ORF Transcript_34583/g.75590 Transcript_34583/m.75590 type:complete len:726 (-) Transcript_34583:480-2657(-)
MLPTLLGCGLLTVLCEHCLDLSTGEGLLLEQALRQELELLAVGEEDVLGADVGGGEHRLGLLLDELLGLARQLDPALVVLRQQPHLVAHAVLGHHVPRQPRRLLQVAASAGGDLRLPKNELLRHAPPHADVQAREQLLAGDGGLVALGELRDHAERHAARHDGGLVHGEGPVGVQRHQRVPALVVRRQPPVRLADHRALALRPHQDAVLRPVQALHVHRAVAVARRLERGDVDQVGEVRAAQPGGAAGDDVQVHLLPALHPLEVPLQYLPPPLHVWVGHHHRAVEAARAHERLVEALVEVGGGDDDDALVGLEAVQLHQNLVQRHAHVHLVLRVAAPADGVDLVDEDDGGALLAGLREEVAHAGGPHPHEHLHEVAPADGQEGHPRLARRRLGQQRLARAGGAHQERPLRHLAAQVLVLPRVLQEAHELHHLRLRLVAPGHVLEHHLGLGVLVEGADRRLAHGEDAAPPAHAAAAAAHAAAHLAPREPQPPREEEQGGRQADHLRLPAHLRGVHHRQVAARVDAHDVLRLLQLALEGLDAANVEEELVGGLAVGVGDEAHLARGAVGANVHLGNRLVQDLDFLNHTLLEELVLEFLEADFLCFRTIQEERHRGETKESPCYQQLLCRLVCQNIAEALSLLLSPWWCLIWFLLAATIGALVLGIKVLEAVLLGCVRESATERPWGRLGPDLRQFWKLPHHVRPTGKRCQSATGKRARSCSSVLHPS